MARWGGRWWATWLTLDLTRSQEATILFWVYQFLAVGLLAAASMTAFQDAQATEWRDVAIGEIPEAIVYRDPRGTFTRSVTITFGIAVLIMFLVRGETTRAVPFYGVGVFMPIMVMGLAVRKHILQHYTGRVRRWGSLAQVLPPPWQRWYLSGRSSANGLKAVGWC